VCLLTNTTQISELAGRVQGLSENHNYELAHSAVDLILLRAKQLHKLLEVDEANNCLSTNPSEE